jgi:NADPH:quinone reductase-like Zn-dependent oxidoreductase
MVGAPYAAMNLDCLNERGRLVYIATQGGASAEVDLLRIMRRRLVLTGSTLRPRDAAEKARLAAAVETEVWPLFHGAGLKPEIDQVFPLADAGAAHARLEGGEHLGKVMLRVHGAG